MQMNGSVIRCERNILRALKSRVNTFKKELRLYPEIIESYIEDSDSEKCCSYTKIVDNLVKYTPGVVENPEFEMEFFLDEIETQSDSDIDSNNKNDSDYEQDFDQSKEKTSRCQGYSKILDILPSNSDNRWFDVRSKISNESFMYLSDIYYEFKIVVSKMREIESLTNQDNVIKNQRNSENTSLAKFSLNNTTRKVRKLSEVASISYFFNELLPEISFSTSSELCINNDETGFPSVQESLKNESIDSYSSDIQFTRKLSHSKISIQQRFYLQFTISELLLLLFSNFQILAPLIPILINFCSSKFNLLSTYLKKLYLSGVPLNQFCSVLEAKDYSMNFESCLKYLCLKKFDISVLENKFFLEKLSKGCVSLEYSKNYLYCLKNLIKLFEKIISSIPNKRDSKDSKELFERSLYFILSLLIRMDHGEHYTIVITGFLNKIVNEMNERAFKYSEIEKIQFLISYILSSLNLSSTSAHKNIWKLAHDFSTIQFIVRISNEQFITKFIKNFYTNDKQGLLKAFSKTNLSLLFRFKNLHFRNHVRSLISFFLKHSESNLQNKDPLNILVRKSTRAKAKKSKLKKQRLNGGGII